MKIIPTKQFLFGLMALALGSLTSAADVYTYDKLNRLTKVQYSNGASVTYNLDGAGNIQSITNVPAPTLTAQTIHYVNVPTLQFGQSGMISATATSGLAVAFSTTTGSICSVAPNGQVNQATVTGNSNGTCRIAANQAGDGVFAPAPELPQYISITGTAPSAPTITSVVAGPGRITINFTAPTSTGGAAIASYTATCTAVGKPPRSATGPGTVSSLVVGGLAGGANYTCTLTAWNGTSNSAGSTTPPTIPARATDLTPILMLLLD